jgi:hypothetical protein
LAGFGKPEWHVVLMEFNDQLLLEFMQVTWIILPFPACSIFENLNSYQVLKVLIPSHYLADTKTTLT